MSRPTGRKNNKTLMREASKEQMAKFLTAGRGYLMTELEGVLKAMVEEARSGNVAAAKLILDRLMPARKATDELPGGVSITVNVGGYDEQAEAGRGVTLEAEHSLEGIPDGAAHAQGNGTGRRYLPGTEGRPWGEEG